MQAAPRARAPFFKVSCQCGHEQIVFSRAASKVPCGGCKEPLAEPTGGRAKINGEVLESLE